MSKFKEVDLQSILTNEIPQGISLFSKKDVDILKHELSDTDEYTVLYEEDDRKMWYKVKGEGSGKIQDGDVVHNQAAAESPFIRYKYSCDFDDCTLEEFYDTMRDYAKRFEWDDRDAGREVVSVIHSPEADLPYQVVEHFRKKGTLLVADRDFITLNAEFWEGDTMYCLGTSAEHPLVGEPDKGAVRSVILYLGTCIERIADNKIRVWFVTQTDPKGWISSALVNWAQKFLPKEFKANMCKGMSLRAQKTEQERTYVNYYQVDGKQKLKESN